MIELALLVGFIIGGGVGAVLGASRVVKQYIESNPPPIDAWSRPLPPTMPSPPPFPPLAIPPVDASDATWNRYLDKFDKLDAEHAKRTATWDDAMQEALRQLKAWGERQDGKA